MGREQINMRKSSGTAFLLWALCFVGAAGIHRIYARRYVTGVLWLFTFGLLGIGQFIDLFLIDGMVRDVNQEEALREAQWRWFRDSLTRTAPARA
jgi:TM2 domain-containing membrane protein YozV